MLTATDSGTTTAKKKTPYTADQVAATLAGGYRPPGGIATVNPGTVAGFSAPPAASAAAAAPTDPFSTNPGYLAALAAEQAGSQQADAALRSAQEAAIVGYGDPSLAAALGFSVDANTAAAARQNYLAGNSSLARLDKQRDLNQQGNVNNLAAHGILFSGELGYQQGQIGQRYGNAVYDTQQQLLAGLNAAAQQAQQTKAGLRNQTVGALTNAYDLMVQNPQFYAAATPPKTTPAGPAGVPSDVTSALASGAFGARGATPSKSRLATKPLPNPYTTGQKRFG